MKAKKSIRFISILITIAMLLPLIPVLPIVAEAAPDNYAILDARFLTDYGQNVFCSEPTTTAPAIDGTVNANEYSIKAETTFDKDYELINDSSQGGTWGLEWANYYISWDDECIYIAAEILDNTPTQYCQWPDVPKRADQFCFALGGMIDTPAPEGIASRLEFRFFDGNSPENIEAGESEDYFEIQDMEKDFMGGNVSGAYLDKNTFVKSNKVVHDQNSKITTYEAAIYRDAIESVWPHHEGDLQYKLFTFGAHVQDTSTELNDKGVGCKVGIKWWGTVGPEVNELYDTLTNQYDSVAFYGWDIEDPIIPNMFFLGTEEEYESFKAERLYTEIETEPRTEPETEPEIEPENVSLYVGYAREDITPPEEMLPSLTLTGYADAREITSIESNLYASCTAFKDANGNIALIYTLDLHSMKNSQATGIITQITKATGVPKANIILNVTHTHAAPSLAKNYLNDVITPSIVKAAEDAIADLKPCIELYAGEIYMRASAFIRRYIEDESGNKVAHMGEMDNMVPVARFVRHGGKDVIMVNFAAHCDTVKGRAANTLSADYVAAFRESMEEQLDCHFAMQNGASGDVSPATQLDEPSLYDGRTKTYGRRLADLVISEINNLPKLEIIGEIKSDMSTVKVNVNHTEDHLAEEAEEVKTLYYAGDMAAAEAKMKEYGFESIYAAEAIGWRLSRGVIERRPVSAICIGNILFAAADYEMFTKTGRNIKNAGNEHADLTFMCAYSNGMESGYIPPIEIFEYDFYEVYSCIYEPGTAELIEAGIIKLINEVIG